MTPTEKESTMTPTEKAIEAMAVALCEAQQPKGAWDRNPAPNYRSIFRDEARVAITALISLHPGIASLIEGTGVVVPKEPTKTMMHAFLRAGPMPEKPFRECYRAMLAAAEAKPHD